VPQLPKKQANGRGSRSGGQTRETIEIISEKCIEADGTSMSESNTRFRQDKRKKYDQESAQK